MKKGVILISGPSGCDRDAYLRGAIEKGTDTQYYSVFEYMQKAAKRAGKKLEEMNVDLFPKREREKWRDEVFNEIKHEIERSDKHYHVVSTTCIFYYADWIKEEGLNEKLFQIIEPNVVIAFLDDLIEMKKRLLNSERWNRIFMDSGGPPLNFLAKWREDSVNFLRDMSLEYRYRKLPTGEGFVTDFYIFARQHPKETLFSLIYERDQKLKLYLSYPISEGREELSRVEEFRDKLSENYIVFDPYTIKDWDIVKSYDSLEENQNSMKIGDVKLPRKEVEDALNSIRTQVVGRDFAIIDSVDAVVVYHHTKEPSAGVMAEIIYARRNRRPVFGYYPFPRPSPFLEYFMKTGEIPTMYKNEEEVIQEIDHWKEYLRTRTI
jgi:hypothetical protein